MEIRPILSALMRSKTGAVLVAVQVAISLAILANALHIVNVRQAVAARPSGVAAENDVFTSISRTSTVAAMSASWPSRSARRHCCARCQA